MDDQVVLKIRQYCWCDCRKYLCEFFYFFSIFFFISSFRQNEMTIYLHLASPKFLCLIDYFFAVHQDSSSSYIKHNLWIHENTWGKRISNYIQLHSENYSQSIVEFIYIYVEISNSSMINEYIFDIFLELGPCKISILMS